MPNGKAFTIEAERWLTLNAALEHIRNVQNCTPIEAQRQLKVHIADGTIPVKWADSEGANDIPKPKYLQGTKLKVNLEGSSFVASDSKPGSAHDKFLETYRPLLVWRDAVFTTWPDGTRTDKQKLQKPLESQKPVAARTENENEQIKWITLVDAEEHIEVLQKCDSVEALRQLKEEIGDGIVAVKWADESTDNPDVTIIKTSEFILTGPGFAPDGKEYRPLLILRADILRLWPAPDAGSTGIAVGGTHRKPHGKASPDSIREAARKVYRESHSKPPNIEEAWPLIKKELPNASRDQARKILKEPEFEKQRLKPGNQSRR
jgi:hypothetical protein